MRKQTESQPSMFYAIDLDEMVPQDHPLRPIKIVVDRELAKLSRLFNEAYSRTGRPSVPPEWLLKSMLLMALYSIRSERQLVERLRFDLLFRWFLGMEPGEPVFDATAFTHNRKRLDEFQIVQRFFDQIVKQALLSDLASGDHFSVDGTLIRSWGSFKSLQPIEPDESDDDPRGGGGAGRSRNDAVDFRGTKRSNATHRSTTDPEARLYWKGQGNTAFLSHTGHVVTENRHGLVIAVSVAEANGRAERAEALEMLEHVKHRHRVRPRTLAADKGYDAGEFLLNLEARSITPHVATRKDSRGPSWSADGRSHRPCSWVPPPTTSPG